VPGAHVVPPSLPRFCVVGFERVESKFADCQYLNVISNNEINSYTNEADCSREGPEIVRQTCYSGFLF
jgi:hypothetical protein